MADNPPPEAAGPQPAPQQNNEANKTAKKDEPKKVLTNDKGEALIGKVRVYSPYKVYYDGPAASVSAVNDTGPFDVLPGHKNFMTLLSEGEIVVRTPKGGEEHIKGTNSIMHVSEDVVRVFLDV